MVFREVPDRQPGVELLQRALERGRLAHAYLFTGHQIEELEAVARALAQTLNCERPVKRGAAAIDACDSCSACLKIKHDNHADLHWVRPESKTRTIRIEQIRGLIQEVNLKPTEARYKIGVIVAADRLRTQAANAFLKTLEEPPARSVLVLLTTQPQRILETILSRCLRLNFAGAGLPPLAPAQQQWLGEFSRMAAGAQQTLLGRYRLMDGLVQRLNEAKAQIERQLSARSPLQRYTDVEKALAEKWEDELTAAVEAEYRRQRADLLALLHWWLRDIWVQRLSGGDGSPEWTGLLNFPGLTGAKEIAQRLTPQEALANLDVVEQLQRWLSTNVQESLALEVGLLKLRL